MKIGIKCKLLFSALVALFAICQFARVLAQEPKKCSHPKLVEQDRLQYRIGKKYLTVESPSYPSRWVLQVSVDPKFLNKKDLLRIAELLNKDFCHEKRLDVFIFSDHNSAKRFVFNGGSPYFPATLYALRADYSLDRTSGYELINFYPNTNNREYETIVVSEKPAQFQTDDKQESKRGQSPP